MPRRRTGTKSRPQNQRQHARAALEPMPGTRAYQRLTGTLRRRPQGGSRLTPTQTWPNGTVSMQNGTKTGPREKTKIETFQKRKAQSCARRAIRPRYPAPTYTAPARRPSAWSRHMSDYQPGPYAKPTRYHTKSHIDTYETIQQIAQTN